MQCNGRLRYVTGRLWYVTGRLRYVTGRLRYVTGRLQCVTKRVRYVTGRLQCVNGRVRARQLGRQLPGRGDARCPLGARILTWIFDGFWRSPAPRTRGDRFPISKSPSLANGAFIASNSIIVFTKNLFFYNLGKSIVRSSNHPSLKK